MTTATTVFAGVRERLVSELLCQAKDYENIIPVWDIIQEMPVFKFVPSIFPIRPEDCPVLSSAFGRRVDPLTGTERFHTGIDLTAKYAASIYATAAGTVTFVGYQLGYGNCVIVKHAFGFVTVYGHLTAFYCVVGQTVGKGQIIAFLGNTGRSTGAHLHFEVRKNRKAVNPINFILL